jgi:hypothetical protein
LDEAYKAYMQAGGGLGDPFDVANDADKGYTYNVCGNSCFIVDADGVPLPPYTATPTPAAW